MRLPDHVSVMFEFFSQDQLPPTGDVVGMGWGHGTHPIGRVVKKGLVLKPPNIPIGISFLHQSSYINVRQQSTLFLGRSDLFSRTKKQGFFCIIFFSPVAIDPNYV